MSDYSPESSAATTADGRGDQVSSGDQGSASADPASTAERGDLTAEYPLLGPLGGNDRPDLNRAPAADATTAGGQGPGQKEQSAAERTWASDNVSRTTQEQRENLAAKDQPLESDPVGQAIPGLIVGGTELAASGGKEVVKELVTTVMGEATFAAGESLVESREEPDAKPQGSAIGDGGMSGAQGVSKPGDTGERGPSQSVDPGGEGGMSGREGVSKLGNAGEPEPNQSVDPGGEGGMSTTSNTSAPGWAD